MRSKVSKAKELLKLLNESTDLKTVPFDFNHPLLKELPPFEVSEMIPFDSIPVITDISEFFGVGNTDFELYEDQSYNGSHIAYKFHPDTEKNLINWMKVNGVPNPNTSRLHISLFTHDNNIEWNGGKRKLDIEPKHTQLERFKGAKKNFLFLRIHHPELDKRRLAIEKSLGLESKNRFQHHVTLSYNVGDWHPPKNLSPINFPLHVNREELDDLYKK
jgi:hypothetical protein